MAGGVEADGDRDEGGRGTQRQHDVVLRHGAGAVGSQDRGPALRQGHAAEADAGDDDAGNEPGDAVGLRAGVHGELVAGGGHDAVATPVTGEVHKDAEQDDEEANNYCDVLEVRGGGHTPEACISDEQEDEDRRDDHGRVTRGLLTGGEGDHGAETYDLDLDDGDEGDDGNQGDELAEERTAVLVADQVGIGVVVEDLAELPHDRADEEHADGPENEVHGYVGRGDSAQGGELGYAEQGWRRHRPGERRW